jgi:hypothetical protein
MVLANAFRLGLLASAAGLLAPAAGQTVKPYRYDGGGYVAYGIGACHHGVTNVSVGVGGHAFLWRGLTLGGDIGYYRFAERNSSGFGIATLDVGYHFVDRRKPGKLDSYFAAGVVGLAFGPGSATSAASVSGGINYWFKPRLGLHTGFRVTAIPWEAIAMFRVGLSFR